MRGFLVLIVCLAALVTPSQVRAQSVNELVVQLRAHPNDEHLRSRIIRSVLAAHKKPALPSAFREKLGAGNYAFKNARGTAGYAAAAQMFEEAALVAPWVPDAYYNMGLAYEGAKDYNNAIKSFHLYLTAAPNAPDADKISEKLGALKYAASHAAEADAVSTAIAPRSTGVIKLLCHYEGKPADVTLTLDSAGHQVDFVSLDGSGGHLSTTNPDSPDWMYRVQVWEWTEDAIRFGNDWHILTLNRLAGTLHVIVIGGGPDEASKRQFDMGTRVCETAAARF